MTLHLTNARLIDPENLTAPPGSPPIDNGPITAVGTPNPITRTA